MSIEEKSASDKNVPGQRASRIIGYAALAMLLIAIVIAAVNHNSPETHKLTYVSNDISLIAEIVE